MGAITTGAEDPTAMLRRLEREWRPHLEQVSLAAELELTRQDFEPALRCLGILWRRAPREHLARPRFRSAYPSCFVVGVSGVAGVGYAGNALWPAVFEAAGLSYENGGPDTAVWGRIFTDCLEELRLPTFPALDEERARRYVSRILIHGGVPIDHVDEFFDVIDRARGEVGDSSRRELHGWLIENRRRLYHIPRSLKRLLVFGDEYVEDLIDRFLDLLDQVRDGAEVDDVRVGLPRRYVERAVQLRELGELPGTRRASKRTVGRTSQARPQVRFDPYGLGVHLLLPPDADEPAAWTITTGDRTERVPVAGGREAAAGSLLLPESATQVEARSSLATDGTVITIVDEADPLMVFDGTGQRVPPSAALPREPVWAVHPSGQAPETGDSRIVERHETVTRWPGWSAMLVDLTGGGYVRLGSGRARRPGAHRSAVLDGHALADVTSDRGLPVHGAWPSVVLPASQRTTSWDLSVSDLLDPARQVTWTHEVDDHDHHQPLDEMAAELSGRPVRIRARGPLGRSLRTDIVVLPGLDVDFVPDLRKPVEQGLSPTRIVVAMGDQDITDEVLGPDHLRLVVEVGAAAIEVEPPSIALRHLRTGRPGTWRRSAINTTLESILDDAGSLAVRLPGADHARLELLGPDGALVQETVADQRSRADGSQVFNLGRFTDTLAEHGAGVLRIRSSVFTGAALRVQPGRLVASLDARPERGLIEAWQVSTEGVRLGLYPRLAPGRDPVVVDLPRGDATVAVPGELLGTGPLRALARIDDPWVPEPWPTFPADGPNVHDLDFEPTPGVLDTLHPLAGWLSGRDVLPPLEGHVAEAIEVYQHARHLHLDRTSADIRRTLGSALSGQPSAFLHELLHTDLDGPTIARATTESGVVAGWADGISVDEAERLWARWPGAGALAVLPRLAGRGDEREEALELLRQRCGDDEVDALLAGQRPECLAQPRLDGPDMREMPRQVIEHIRRESGIVPKLLLDDDDRAADGFGLVMAFQDSTLLDRLQALVLHGHHTVDWVLRNLLHGDELAPLAEGIRARQQGESWRELPAVSLAAATAARLAARSGRPEHVFRHQSRDHLTTLTIVAPRLVAADLVMAELAIQGATRG